MDLQEVLKKFKRVRPDANYTAYSRNQILNTPLPERRSWRAYFGNPWQVVARSLELGSAIALAGLLLVFVLGGFSAWHFLSPLHLEGLDPSALQAEAQAVDMQLELARVHYNETSSPANMTSTAPMSASAKSSLKQAAEQQAKNLGISSTTSSSSEPSVDQTLQMLSQ